MQTPAELTRLACALCGLPIMGCLPGSPAQRAGMRYGDIVLSVNGVPTPSWHALFRALHPRGSLQSLRVFRQGSTFSTVIDLPATARTPRHLLEPRGFWPVRDECASELGAAVYA